MHPLWRAVFGNDHPVEIEIGPGTGSFLLPAAQHAPEINFFGIERSRGRAARLEQSIARLALSNARIINADAACALRKLIPAESVAAYHVYFPDPWWKRRHHHRRLFTPAFAAALAHTLSPGGRIHVATDVDAVFALMLESLESAGSLLPDASSRSPRVDRTGFERKGLAQGAIIREATFAKRAASAPHTSSAAPMTPAESPS
jgi:tRNA (guanine-N7-)-methyltransferase